MAGIPAIREELMDIAEELTDHPDPKVRALGTRIFLLAVATLRNRKPDKAPVSANPITPEIKAAVFKMHKEHPELRGDQIGAALNINQGRVYEILDGQR